MQGVAATNDASYDLNRASASACVALRCGPCWGRGGARWWHRVLGLRRSVVGL